MTGPTLAGRLARLVSAGFLLVWIGAVLAMVAVLGSEQDELYDHQLVMAAEALGPALSDMPAAEDLAPNPDPEALAYRVIDAQGRVIRASGNAADFPAPTPGAFSQSAAYRVYTTQFDPAGRAVQVGDPLAERAEAWRESFLAFLLPMCALLPLGYVLVRWITKVSLRPLDGLRAEMARRDGGTLAPLDTTAQPRELAGIAEALNGFMARLAQALEGERAFATNAAHELRTPVAVALAQTRRLRAETDDPAALTRITALETALGRMSHLVARLLQLARAEAGVGPGQTPVDARMLLPHVLRDIDGADRIDTTLPPAPVMTQMDADAFAIVLGNLADNALRHSPAGSRVQVTLTAQGVLGVTNDGPALPPEALARLTTRFMREPGARPDGFGLGLHIVTQIAHQAGTTLVLKSPAPGRPDGFAAFLTLS